LRIVVRQDVSRWPQAGDSAVRTDNLKQ